MIWLRRIGACLALALSLVTVTAHSQDMSAPIEDEVRQRLRVNTNINPLGENAFGENVNLYNGTLSFEQTDVDLRGTGPEIKLTRSYSVADTTAPWWRAFVDWSLEIPHIETLTTPSYTSFFISPPVGRCSGMASDNGPQPISIPNNAGGPPVEIDPIAWWYGIHLDMPGEGQEDLLLPQAQNTRPLPQVTLSSGQVVQATMITKNNYAIACLPTTSNGAGGEGFLAIGPDGTQYYLDRLVYRRANNYGDTAPYQIVRNLAMMMVSKVIDRFGNTLTYTYDGNNNLTSIAASDGRSVSLSYTNYTIQPTLELSNPDPGYRVNTATVTASDGTSRTWQYGYETGSTSEGDLQSVTLPDGSSWQFSLDAFREYEDVPDLDMVNYNPGGVNCQYALEPQNAKTLIGTITSPSGLQGSFTTQNTIRGESYVPYVCVPSVGTEYLQYRNVMAYTALTQKQYSGPGLPSTYTWNYSYSAPNQSWTTDSCASNASCPTTVYTDVVDPNGNDVHYTFSNKFDSTESQLVDTSSYQGAAGSTLLEEVKTSYAPFNQGPWPSSLGFSLGGELNTSMVTTITPLSEKQILQNGDTYTWQAVAFDSYAKATDTKRYNSIGSQPSIEELSSYLYDTNLWVIGLPLSVTNAGTSEVETSYAYNTSDLLASRSKFGELLMSYTYDGQGNLNKFKDGNGNITTLSNYYRGIPQAIAYPDGTTSSAIVSDYGDVTSETNQRGNTTSYKYDSLGRVTQIIYPTNDTVSWNTTNISYTQATSSELGIAAGHWDRTETTGFGQKVTYYDAELRPILDYTSDGNADTEESTAKAYDWTGATTFTSFAWGDDPPISDITEGVHNTYDALGRLQQTLEDGDLGPQTTTINYLAGAGKQITDPKSNVTTTYYQALDKPSYGDPLQVNAPEGVTQTIARDVYGNPTSITQSGNYGSEVDSVTKTLTYDSYHRVCRTTEPESGSTVISYDAANNIQWTARGQNITDGTCGQSDVASSDQTVRTYDQMNRLKTVAPPTGTQASSFTYDPDGNLLTSASGIANETYYYNTRDLVTAEVLAVPGYTWGLGYTYDGNGHVSAIGYPNANGISEGVALNPDAFGRPFQVGRYVSQVSYFPNNDVAGFTFGNGEEYIADETINGWPSQFSYFTSSGVDLGEQFTYDNNGNLTNVADSVNGPRTKAFTYDGLDRLTNATATQLYGTETYTYDAINNLRSRLTAGNALTLNYDGNNRLASVTQGANVVSQYTYDLQGNRAGVTGGGATTQYTFDAENQLQQVSGVEGYAYDAAGRRVAKLSTTGVPTDYYFYDRAGRLMFSLDATTLAATNYIYLGNLLIAKDAYVGLQAPSITFSPNPSTGNFIVSWGSVAQATSYTLQELGGSIQAWTTVYTGSGTAYSVSGSGGGYFNFRIQACNSLGCSAWVLPSNYEVVLPPIPTVTVPGGVQNGPYTVSWTSSSGIGYGYTLQESFNGGAWNTVVQGTGNTSFVRPGNVSGSYTYQVEALDPTGLTQGWSATSSAVTVNTNYGTVPIPAPSLTVPSTSSTGSVTLSWTSSSPVTSYAVQEMPPGASTWTTVYSGTGTSVSLSGLADGTYKFQVQACNTQNGETACTSWISGGANLVVAIPPNAPTLTVPSGTQGNGGYSNYSVTWTTVATATTYNLQQRVNGGAWTTVQSTSATSWSATGEGDGTYAYQVQACYQSACGGWSSIGTVTVLLPPTSAPTISGAGTTTSGSFTLTWNTVANASSYTVFQVISSNEFQQVQSSSATSYSTTVGSSGTYQYFVEACNVSGCGPSSSTATETATLVPPPPTGVTTQSIPQSAKWTYVYAEWNTVAGATSYQVENRGTGQINYTGTATQYQIYEILYPGGTVEGKYPAAVRACNAVGCSTWVSVPGT